MSLRRKLIRNCLRTDGNTSNIRRLVTFQTVELLDETKSFEDIPGPQGILGLPYLGIALQFYPFTKHTLQRFDLHVKDLQATYGSICKVRRSINDWSVFLFDPQDVQEVFRNDNKYPFRACLPLFHTYNKRRNRIPTMGERNGEDWWTLRSPAQKVIARQSQVQKFIPKISEVADDFVRNYKGAKYIRNLPYPCMEYATEGLGTLCFDARLNCLQSHKSGVQQELMIHVENYFSYFGEQLLKPMHWFKWFKTPSYNKFERASDYIMSMAEHHIKQCKENLNEKKDGINLMKDMLACPHVTETTAVAILTDFFRGGIDSTANGLTFFLYHLAKHTDIQEKLFEEVSRVIGPEGQVTESEIQSMEYLRACLKESFRMIYPILIGTQRVLEKDVWIRNYHIPAGVTVNFCISSMVSDEKYFPEPDRFLPERWIRSSEYRQHIHPFSFIPFGFGPRGCVGQRFAEREILICAAKMVRNFHLSLPDGLTNVSFVYNTFAKPENPFSIKLHPRECYE